MKKKLSFLLAIVMVLSLTTTALATEVPISSIESMRTYLTEVGVEEEFINTVSDEMITSLYDEMSSVERKWRAIRLPMEISGGRR